MRTNRAYVVSTLNQDSVLVAVKTSTDPERHSTELEIDVDLAGAILAALAGVGAESRR
jgi:hypothetical protein